MTAPQPPDAERALLPCPFCGDSAVIETKGNNRTTSRSATVKCKGCRAQITNSGIRTSMEGVVKYSTDAWNKRVPAADSLGATGGAE